MIEVVQAAAQAGPGGSRPRRPGLLGRRHPQRHLRPRRAARRSSGADCCRASTICPRCRAAATSAPGSAPTASATAAGSTRRGLDESIEHLRRYSNYLSPKVGFFSADTWSMATIWLRNTLLDPDRRSSSRSPACCCCRGRSSSCSSTGRASATCAGSPSSCSCSASSALPATSCVSPATQVALLAPGPGRSACGAAALCCRRLALRRGDRLRPVPRRRGQLRGGGPIAVLLVAGRLRPAAGGRAARRLFWLRNETRRSRSTTPRLGPGGGGRPVDGRRATWWRRFCGARHRRARRRARPRRCAELDTYGEFVHARAGATGRSRSRSSSCRCGCCRSARSQPARLAGPRRRPPVRRVAGGLGAPRAAQRGHAAAARLGRRSEGRAGRRSCGRRRWWRWPSS